MHALHKGKLKAKARCRAEELRSGWKWPEAAAKAKTYSSRFLRHLLFQLYLSLNEGETEMLETVRYLLGSAGASGFGSKSTAEEVTEASPDVSLITAIITGATSGIGAETARVLAMRGARLVLPARSLKAAEETKERILGEFPGTKIIVLPLDLSSLSSVRSFVSHFLSLRLPLNLLINNAGKFSHNYALSEDSVELTFATNYLGHFLLTKLLLERMAETAASTGIEGRIVNVTSGIHSWFSGDCLQYLNLLTRKKMPYDATRAYALSKLANVLHTIELSTRLERMGARVTANCVHPGIVRTRLTRDREGFLTGLSLPLPMLTNHSNISVAIAEVLCDDRSGVLHGFEAYEDDCTGGGDDVLRCGSPGGGRGVGEVLRGLQRSVAVAIWFESGGGGAVVVSFGGDGGREAAAGVVSRDVMRCSLRQYCRRRSETDLFWGCRQRCRLCRAGRPLYEVSLER